MAVSYAALSATEIALKAADKPILGGYAIPREPDDARWNTAGTTSGTDITEDEFPASRGYDGKAHLPTKPDTTGTLLYYVLDLGTDVEFDAVALIGHNLGSNSATAVLQVDNSATPSGAFATPVDVATFTPSGDGRLIEWELMHTGSDPLRYDTQFVRLKITAASGFTPEIGDLVLVRRRQLKHKASGIYDEYSFDGDSDRSVSKSGVITNYIFNEGRFRMDFVFRPSEDAYISDLVDWFLSDYAARPFVWCENPGASPNSWQLMVKENTSFRIPKTGWIEREFPLSADEQGPERFYLNKEA